MAIGHHLNIKETRRGVEQEHTLGSYIHQTESPIISRVDSLRFHNTDSEAFASQGIIRVGPMGPSGNSPFGKEGYDVYSTAGVEHNGEPMKGMFSGGHVGPNVGAIIQKSSGITSRLWVPHEDVHEALAAHHGLQPTLSQEELKGFNHPLALQRLLNTSPAHVGAATALGESKTLPDTLYKGIVHVSHIDKDLGRSNYMYNPQTEEMHRYG
jgi:hypothetical protein